MGFVHSWEFLISNEIWSLIVALPTATHRIKQRIMEKGLSFTYRSAFRKRSCVPVRPDHERSSNFVRGQRHQHRLHLLAGALRASYREQCPAPAAGSEWS